MTAYVIGVDAGNSKTDVVLVSVTGRVLAETRGIGIDSPYDDQVVWRELLTGLVDEARRKARIPLSRKASAAVFYLANIDFPAEARLAKRLLQDVGSELTVVGNDTLAVLKAGATHSWGVAAVAGAGINAVGVHPSGRTAGFLALGDYTGDTGGGLDVGIRGLGAAMRHEDKRGPATVLSKTVPAFYGLRRPTDVAIAVYRGTIAHDDLLLLAPVVYAAAAAGDLAARGILDDFADEVATMVGALIRRLHLTRTDVEVVLGGGTLQAGDAALFERIRVGVTAVAPAARLLTLDVRPVFGAVAEALRLAGASETTITRTRRAFQTTA